MLKSLSEADGWIAFYALPVVPFIKVVPLIKWGLLLQDHEQKLVGYVPGIGVRAVVADAPQHDGARFVAYYRPIGLADYDADTFNQLQQHVVALGGLLAEAQEEASDG